MQCKQPNFSVAFTLQMSKIEKESEIYGYEDGFMGTRDDE